MQAELSAPRGRRKEKFISDPEYEKNLEKSLYSVVKAFADSGEEREIAEELRGKRTSRSGKYGKNHPSDWEKVNERKRKDAA